jgi:FixJ family two-component response regulator
LTVHDGWGLKKDRRPPVDKKMALVVDDEKNIRLTFSETLHQMGYDTRTASNGEEAMTKLQDTEFALVLLDFRMPGMDGIAVLRRIRDVYPKVPVIIITAHGTIKSAVEAMKLGAVDFIQKPCTPAEIRELVGKIIERAAIDETKVEDYPTLIELCKRHVTDRRLEEAKAVAQRALAMDPGRPEAYNLIGAFQECRGEWVEAQKYYRTALEIDPSFKPAQANLDRTGSFHRSGQIKL